MRDTLYDAVAVGITTKRVRLLDRAKSLREAEAIVRMAVMRLGVETEFYAEVPADLYHEGDIWQGRAGPKKEAQS